MSRTVLAPAFALTLAIAVAPPTDSQEAPIVIRAGGLLDVDRGELVRPGLLVVQGDRIVAVGGEAPAGAEVIDLGDLVLLPGMVDAHVHLTLDSASFRATTVTDGAADQALRAARNAELTLDAGFTTVRNVGTVNTTAELVDVALAHAVAEGRARGPRIIPAGHALSITGGHIDPAMFLGTAEGLVDLGPEHGVADGVDEVVRAVRYQIKHGAQVIKIAATAGVMSLEGSVGAQQYSAAEMEAIVAEAERHGMAVAAHAHGAEGILAAVEAGVASIEHGSLLDDAGIAAMKERGTFLVPTHRLGELIPMDELPAQVRAKAEAVFPLARQNLERAIAAGVRIAVGTDAPLVPHGRNAEEITALVARGMIPADAIRAATVNAAELLRLDDRGRLEPGLLADVIAVAGDPLADVSTLEDARFVMLGGEVVVPLRDAAPAGPPATDVWLGALDLDARPAVSGLVAVTDREGYDNQPFFTADGGLLFSSDRPGDQTDVYRFDLRTGEVTRLTDTPASEYSPTPLPDGSGFSAVHLSEEAQQLWHFDSDGADRGGLLDAVQPVGYHAWADADTVALFVLGDEGSPHTLRLTRLSTGEATMVAADIGRSLHRVPGRDAISFVDRSDETTWWISELDLASGEISRLVPTRPGEEDYAWAPDGTLLMGQGSTLFAWRDGGDWTAVAELAAHGVEGITRLAVSPDGSRVALVAERAE